MNALETIKNLSFGTELEYTGISRQMAAAAIKNVVGGSIQHTGGSYDAWEVRATDGRIWKAISDGSLGNFRNSAEIVTPILRYEDIDQLQKVVRELRKAGAKATRETSQHVHVGIADFSARQLANLARIYYKQEELILKAVGTWEHRLAHYTQPTEESFIERLERIKPQTMEELNRSWFGELNLAPVHYDGHRYHGLNLNNIWRIGTVEFRIFNGTTHAGEVKANIQLALAIAAKAKTAHNASSRHQRPFTTESAKYDFRVFLLRLGMIGDEFKTARLHLLKRLPGLAAWKRADQVPA